MVKDSIQKEIEEIKKEIDSKYRAISYCLEAEERTKKMYPPDGGGHGHRWRTEIEGLRRTIRELEARRAAINNNQEELYKDQEQIYENTANTNKVAPSIISFNQEIKRYLATHPQKLYELSPRKFEELIADILRDFGFDVELTQATRDGGKDIYAYVRNEVCSFLTFVECKRWAPSSKVGLEVVQRLYGVQQINQANKSMIITTSFFTAPAIEECKRYKNQMDLKDYADLKGWLERYKG